MKNSNSVPKEAIYDRAIVAGSPRQARNRVRAWRLAGLEAKNVSAEKMPGDLTERVLVDICSFSGRERLVSKILQSGGEIFLSGALSDNYAKAEKLIQDLTSKGSIFDQMRYHPLISKARDLISDGRIGSPRILKLENLEFTESSLDNFSLFQGLLNGVSCAETLLGSSNLTKVFSRFVKTDYSRFYVALLSFDTGSTCQLIAGNTSGQTKLEFSINGTKGMIAFNESKTLELPKNLAYSDAMRSTTDVEVLTRMFTDFLKGSREGLANLSTYKLAREIQESSKGK